MATQILVSLTSTLTNLNIVLRLSLVCGLLLTGKYTIPLSAKSFHHPPPQLFLSTPCICTSDATRASNCFRDTVPMYTHATTNFSSNSIPMPRTESPPWRTASQFTLPTSAQQYLFGQWGEIIMMSKYRVSCSGPTISSPDWALVMVSHCSTLKLGAAMTGRCPLVFQWQASKTCSPGRAPNTTTPHLFFRHSNCTSMMSNKPLYSVRNYQNAMKILNQQDRILLKPQCQAISPINLYHLTRSVPCVNTS